MKLFKLASKKAISAVLAVAVILCSITSTLSVFADNADNTIEPYKVSWRVPAITMYEDTKINLSNVDVQLTEGGSYTLGNDITWSLDPKASGVFLTDSKDLSILDKGNFKLTATAGGNSLNVWVIANSEGENDFYLENLDYSIISSVTGYDFAYGTNGTPKQ